MGLFSYTKKENHFISMQLKYKLPQESDKRGTYIFLEPLSHFSFFSFFILNYCILVVVTMKYIYLFNWLFIQIN